MGGGSGSFFGNLLTKGTLTSTGAISGSTTLNVGGIISGSSDLKIAGDALIHGDLTVKGTTTTIDSTTMTVDDINLVLASGAANSAAADGAGITIDGASATLIYDHTGTQWEFNKPLEVQGNLLPQATATYDLGSTSLGWNDLHIDSGGIINFDNGDVTVTHSSNVLAVAGGTVTFDGDIDVGDDLILSSDASEIKFGASTKEGKLIHDNGSNPGLILKACTAAAIGFPSFSLQAGDNDITTGNPLGVIHWQAPDDTAGSDAILVAASIEAQAEGSFSSTSNATKLIFSTAVSEAATSKMELSSVGTLTVTGAGIFGAGTSNAQTMSTVTLPANYNSVLYGPITIGSGETVRISAGSNVKIVDIANV